MSTGSTGSASSAPANSIGGLMSGMDTTQIVERLMAIQRKGYDKTSEKVTAERLRLQAYQSINSMLLSVRSSASGLASQSLWKAKAASSSNDKALKATASSSAEAGSHSFRVGKLASSAKYLSKGFSTKESTVISPGSPKQNGTITLESSKAKVDNSAQLEDLNGGKGVFRGSIRLTDSRGTSAVVDLSTCETMEDIIREINGAAGTQVEASIKDGNKLQIADKSGGTGALTIQNVGQGTTATDLGIAGSNASGTITGEKAFYLSADTSLSVLNDGLGVEEGYMSISITGGTRDFDIDVDLTNCRTLSDIQNAVNNTIKGVADGTIKYAPDGISIDPEGEPHPDRALVENFRLAINDDQNGLTFTGAKVGLVYTVSNLQGRDANGNVQLAQSQTVNQLGLLGTYKIDSGDSFDGKRILGDVSSPMLKNLSGANKAGIGTEGSRPKAPAPTFDNNTLLKNLHGGDGIRFGSDPFTIKFYENGDNARNLEFNMDAIRAITTRDDATVGDLLSYLNDELGKCGAAGLQGLEFKADTDARGIYIDGLQSTNLYEISGSLANTLGITGGFSGEDAGQGGLNDLYEVKPLTANHGTGDLKESAKLSELYLNEALITQAEIDDIVNNPLSITFGGNTYTIDMSSLDNDTTVNELITHINDSLEQQVHTINPNATVPQLRSDMYSFGLQWFNVDQTQDFTVSGAGADLLGLSKSYTGQTINEIRSPVQLNLNPVVAGSATPTNVTGSSLLSSLNGGKGLNFIGDNLSLTFGPEGSSATVTITRQEMLEELGNFGSLTVDQYTTALNKLFNDKIAVHPDLGSPVEVAFGIHPDGTGITITNLKGRTDGEEVTLGGDMATAGRTGLLANNELKTDSAFEMPDAADIRGVVTTPSTIAGLGTVKIKVNGTTYELDSGTLDSESTLDDLITRLNQRLVDKGVPGGAAMSFGLNSAGTGLSFSNNSTSEASIIYDEQDTLASDLGLVGKHTEKTDTAVSARSYHNGSTVNRNYISRATNLSTLNGGAGADKGTITLTDAQGMSINIDMSNCVTVGDAIDAINGLGSTNVRASINKTGDGILLEQINTDASGIGDKLSTNEITITNADGLKTAEHLGIAGSGKGGDNKEGDGYSRLDGSMKTVIEIGPNDTLADIMNRVGTASTLYKASIINDGNPDAPWRLSIDASKSGSGSDFIIDCDMDVLGLNKASKGQDSMLLYGQANSSQSPTVLRSATNNNNSAIIGLSLELTEETDNYVTITVKADTEKVVEEIQNMVQSYNDLSDLVSYLDAYDHENDQKGILNSDTTVRTLMESIDDMFYTIFNPNNMSYKDMQNSKEKSAWTWEDLGISLTTNTIASDSENPPRYQKMALDVDALNEMVSSNFEQLFDIMASQRNASNSKLASGAAASASFNFNRTDKDGNPIDGEDFWDPNNAINSDRTTGNWGATNGFTANGTIAEGENEYTIFFQGNVTLDRVSIYHPNSADTPAAKNALKDFTVEYLDATTNKWEILREFTNNTSSASIIGIPANTVAQAIRITAASTNAEDGKFRLLDVQCLESQGLAGKLNQKVNSLTDVVDGYFTTANKDVENKIKDLQDQMEKMAERLDAKEGALWRKFSGMETALSKLKGQGDYLSSYFASVNGK